MTMDRRPIGVFDSGLGGLCAVSELTKILPGEDIIYFGDTGRVPYGSRSIQTLRKYAAEDIAFLLSHDVKMILAACGTVSTILGTKSPVTRSAHLCSKILRANVPFLFSAL